MYRLPGDKDVVITVKFPCKGDDMTLKECGAAAHEALAEFLSKSTLTFRFDKIAEPAPRVEEIPQLVEVPEKAKEEIV